MYRNVGEKWDQSYKLHHWVVRNMNKNAIGCPHCENILEENLILISTISRAKCDTLILMDFSCVWIPSCLRSGISYGGF